MSVETEDGFDYSLLRELTETAGVPGYEDRIREIVRRELKEVVDQIQSDGMGNIVGTINGSTEREIVVAAHMDEIGFMIKHVDDDGFLSIDPLGGWDPRNLLSQRVTVHTEKTDLTGVIGAPPPHTNDGDGDSLEVSDLRIDLGRDPDEVKEQVRPGDLVTLEQTTTRIGDHITGKALDDRVSVLAMLESAARISDPEVTIHFAATVQEEVGLRGARALGVDLAPDLAIALDVTLAQDIPGAEEADEVTELGSGTAIKLKDSSVITNPQVNRRLQKVASEQGIPHQLEVLPAGGTDTAGFQKAGGATPVGAISIPTRYLHSSTECVHEQDIQATIDLLTSFLETETADMEYTL